MDKVRFVILAPQAKGDLVGRALLNSVPCRRHLSCRPRPYEIVKYVR